MKRPKESDFTKHGVLNTTKYLESLEKWADAAEKRMGHMIEMSQKKDKLYAHLTKAVIK